MALAELLYATPLYRVLLAGPAPQRLTCLPPQGLPGDPTNGASILAGTLRCGAQPVRTNAPDWRGTGLTVDALAQLHGFRWLADLAAAGGERAAEIARTLVT